MYEKAAAALGIEQERTFVIGAEGEVPRELLALLAIASAGPVQRNKWRAKDKRVKTWGRRPLLEECRDLWAVPNVCKHFLSLVEYRWGGSRVMGRRFIPQVYGAAAFIQSPCQRRP